MVNRRRALLWALALLLVAGFCALGRWQLQRGDAKQAMLDAAGAVLRDRSAIPLSEAQGHDRHGYDWVSTHGQLLPSPILLLDNQRRGEAVGVRVLGILQPREGRLQLVDLGWLPLPGDRSMPQVAVPAGELALSGLLAPPPGAGLALGPAATPLAPIGRDARWLLTRVEPAALAAQLKLPALDPRLLRLDPALPLGYARDLELLPNTLPPERHRGYALQWFGLAFATFAAAAFMSLRPPPK
jgi:cytochrome oxidase assembly protein ShyY1